MPKDKDKDKALLRQLCDLEVPYAIQLSPNGQDVLYSTQLTWGHRKGKHVVSTLWLAKTGEANSARKLTSGASNDHSPRWHPDGQRIAFLSDRAKQGESSAIYLQDIKDGAESEAITPAGNQRPISMFSFSPDGKAIAFLSACEKTVEQKALEADGEDMQVWGVDWPRSQLRIVNLLSKQITSMTTLDRHVASLCWSPHGDQLGIVTCKTPEGDEPFVSGATISIVDAGLTAVRDLCHFPNAVLDLAWADDGSIYFWSGVPAGTIFCGFAVYAVTNITTGDAGGSRYERVGFGVEDDVRHVFKAGKHIVVDLEHRLEGRVSLLSGQVLYTRKETLEAFDVTFQDDDAGQPILAVATSNTNQPVEVFSVTDNGGALVQLSNHGGAFKDREFGTCSFLSCPSADGEVELDSVYLTPAAYAASGAGAGPKEPLPTLVLIHGGPSTRLTDAFNTYYYMLSPYLLSLGYGILLPNYRGSKGWGERFGSYNIGGVGKYDYEDIISATQHAIEKGFADKNKLLVGGWSHGGLLTLLCSVRNGLHGHSWKFQASIPGASMCDIDAMALTSVLGSSYMPDLHEGRAVWNMDRDDTRNRRGSALWAFKEAMEHSKKSSEMVVPPMLILHGADDVTCHVSNAWALRRALEHYGLPFEMVIYPRQGHIFAEQTFWVDMAIRVGRWCDRYIGSGSE